MTKIFCDIADINLIKKFNRKFIVKGFTTNPSLMRKVGAKNYKAYCQKILKITNKPVSFEVFADDIKNMILQGLKISKWGRNVYVKVPITNSKGKSLGIWLQLARTFAPSWAAWRLQAAIAALTSAAPADCAENRSAGGFRRAGPVTLTLLTTPLRAVHFRSEKFVFVMNNGSFLRQAYAISGTPKR